LNETSKNIEHIIQEVRTLTFDLSSPILYELGFEAAVAEWLTVRIQKEHGIATEFEDDEQPKPLDDDTRTVLFRDVRELLTNVVKHAQAKKVKVSIRKVGSRIHVSVEDDGRGFDPKKVAATAAKAGEFGLFSIRERLKQLGGTIEIESGSGHGTRVILTAPLKSES
jgi:signal transduction histidine kinase